MLYILYVVKALLYETSKIMRQITNSPEDITTLLVASTGTAAFNIGGRTVHYAFHLTAKGFSQKYIPLGEDIITGRMSKYEHLEILIID